MFLISNLAKQLRPPKRIPLDNAAQFFPSVSTFHNTWVFRLTCKLMQTVDPWALQYATEDALKQYPLYRSVLHKGFFWYSLEASNQKPIIRENRGSPCRSLYDKKHKRLLFLVTYQDEYIHLEIYHTLADGVGALAFFKQLIKCYILRKHPSCGVDATSLQAELSPEIINEDSFKTHYSGIPVGEAIKDQHATQHGRSWKKRGYRLKGALEPDGKIKQMTVLAEVNSVTAKAREYGVTATVLLTAVFMLAIQRTREKKQKHKPIVVNIPVNLRKYFPSKSTRNFFQAVNVGHYFHGNTESLKKVSHQISEQLTRELTPEFLTTRLNVLCSLEHHPVLRLVPRIGKDAILRMAGTWGAIHTTSVSNLGQITMPPEYSHYISHFDFTTSTQGVQLNICSYENQMILNIASRLKSETIQAGFLKILLELGIKILVSKA